MFFHAGDGNMHPCILFDERDPAQLPVMLEVGEEILTRCVDFGGSITGGHGIGVEKTSLMEYSFSADTLSAMRDVRRVFDEQSRFNPSKVLPSERGCIEVNKAFSYTTKTVEQAQIYLRRGAPA
ncbi:MAG TPA: FAD-linked oxidase C-terminal domain-containing protein [Abditibacteriaceae bacterium]